MLTSSLKLSRLLVVLLLALLASVQADQRRLSRVRRIIGNASEVNREQKRRMFPFSVTLTGSYSVTEPRKVGRLTLKFLAKKQVHCGASILGKNHVITAAHCLLNSEGRLIASSSWRVYMHGVNRKPGLYERMKSWFARRASELTGSSLARNVAHHAHVKKIHIHPLYDKGNILHDVAVIETSDIRYDDIDHAGPIELPPREVVAVSGPEPGEVCHYSGWGCTRPEGGVRERLLMAQFKVKPLSLCTQIYRDGDLERWKDNLCVQANRTTVCPGDSGGGLRCEYRGRPYLAGIASSAATGESPERYPANFMRLSAYAGWVRQVMAKRN